MTRWLTVIVVLALAIYVGGGLYVGATIALQARDNPLVGAPSDVGLDWEDVTVDSDGLPLPGWWMGLESPRAVLVWAHGGGSNRHSIFWNSLGFYRALHDRGIAVLTFDQRDHGEAPKDDGRLNMGRDESRDVAAAVSWARQRTQNRIPVILMGVSMGGASSIIAIDQGLTVDALILTDPVLDIVDVINNGGWVAYGLPPALFSPLSWGALQFQDLPRGPDGPAVLARRLSVPTLLIQSPDDPVTRAHHARALAAANPGVMLSEAPPVGPSDPCINFKGRWGSHASAYLCHPAWTLSEIEGFLGDTLDLATLPGAADRHATHASEAITQPYSQR